MFEAYASELDPTIMKAVLVRQLAEAALYLAALSEDDAVKRYKLLSFAKLHIEHSCANVSNWKHLLSELH